MRRIPTGSTALGGVALACAVVLLAVAVVRAVGVDSMDGDAALARASGGEAPIAEDRSVEAPERRVRPGSETGRPESPDGLSEPSARPAREGAERSVRAGWEGDAAPDGDAAAAAWDDPLALAVDNDPFNPERRPPPRRYQLPAEREPVVREEPRERPEAPDFRVVGSAAAGGMGVALIQVDRYEPRLVTVGESLQGYTLAAVDGEGATLEGPAGSLRYPVMEPLARRGDDDDRRRGRNDEAERRVREAQERLELMREQIRSMGNVRLRGIEVRPGVILNRGGGVDVPPPPVRVVPRGGGGGGLVPRPTP